MNTASRNCRIGVKNCTNPMCTNAKRRADSANSKRGTAVITPLKASRIECHGPSVANVMPVVAPTTISWMIAIGAIHSV